MKITTAGLLCLAVFSAVRADVGADLRRGNRLLRKGKPDQALTAYEKALVREPDNPDIHYNIGGALYGMQNYDEAIAAYQLGLLKKDRKFQSNVFYNIGNCQFRKGALGAAIDAYRTTLLLNPKDKDAKQNLEYCLDLKRQLEDRTENDSLGQDQAEPEPRPQPRRAEREQAERILDALQSQEKKSLEKSRQPERKERVEKDW